MKKILFISLFIISKLGVAQNDDTLHFESEIQATNHLFSLLDTNIYGNSLLNRALGTGETVLQQMRGQYNQNMTIYNWADIFNAVSLSYTNHNFIPSIQDFGKTIVSTFEQNELNYEGLTQPFSLILNESSYIDSNLLHDPSNFKNIQGKIKPIIDENKIYKKVILKAACLVEFYPDNGYNVGKMIYDSKFIIVGENITLKKVEINLNDGNGYQTFNEQNNILEYNRQKDSLLANARITYEIKNNTYVDRIKFYLTTESNLDGNNNEIKGLFNDEWDEVITDDFPADNIKYRIGIKYGCGNNGKIRRPIIVSPPYRPTIQPFTLNKYYKQFNISNFIDSCSLLGYDVIWIKEKPGNKSLELSGYYLAHYIRYYNLKKKQNYPDEDWEMIVMGYSKGGASCPIRIKIIRERAYGLW